MNVYKCFDQSKYAKRKGPLANLMFQIWNLLDPTTPIVIQNYLLTDLVQFHLNLIMIFIKALIKKG